MQAILEELRDLFEANTLTSHAAESGTNTTNIKVTAHGLVTGDNIINASRGDARRAVTVVDANNFTVTAITGQTAGDNIKFPKFKKYYAGFVDEPPVNYLPVLMVFGNNTSLARKATNRDQWVFNVSVRILTSAYGKVAETDPTDNILQASKQCTQLMEERDANGMPKVATVLGVLRDNILGTSWLYNNNVKITYSRQKIQDKLYFEALLELDNISKFTSRP